MTESSRQKRSGTASVQQPTDESLESASDRAPAEEPGKKLSQKGQVARAKLKRAALEVMERTGYHHMRIHDVTSEAGVAAGLFYHYFKDLKSLTIEVLEDYIAESRNLEEIEKGVAKGDWYARIHAHCSIVVSSYANRPGLMRCLLQMADEDVDFAERIRKSYQQQLQWLVQLMPNMFPSVEFRPGQALLVVYTLASSGEMMLRDYFINHDSELRETPINTEQLAELLAVVFYRGLFLENPGPEKLQYTNNLANMKKADD